jgi:hypothetical protein
MRRTPLLPAMVAAAAGLFLLHASPARADVLVLQDGRHVEGEVEEAGDVYRVRSRFGEATIPVADVKSRTKAVSVDEQVRRRMAELSADDAENRSVVAKWLVELGREEEGRALAAAALEIDPENAAAHAVLGHVRHQGVWRTPDEAKRADGFERHGDRWYTPEEWRSLSEQARTEAEKAEQALRSKQVSERANEAVRLMMSPDPLVAARGRSQLEALAAETGNEKIAALPAQVDELLATRDRMAAAAVSPDRDLVMGELRVTFTRLKRPIQVFDTSLASGPLGAAAPVRIQLPELEVIRVNTTVMMPAKREK